MAQFHLPKTPKEVFKLGFKDWILYNGLITFFKATGRWKYPARASGALETMTTLDKVYWLYKTIYPVKKAERGLGLEEFFAQQKNFQWELPQGFRAKSELTFSAVGDLITHEYLANSGQELYSEVSDLIFGTDISMANLECVLYPKASGNFEFDTRSGPPLYYDADTFKIVKGHGQRQFSFMATACNHSLDFGEEGVVSTIQALHENNIAFHGTNTKKDDAGKATLIEKNGIRIGLISHTLGLNARTPPQHNPLIVNCTQLNDGPDIDLALMQTQIDYCREQKSDAIIAHLHWGMEHELYPRHEQIELGHHLAEVGVDVIIGHHPHVIQPVEFYRTKKNPKRVVPIYYSLGNLINSFSADYLCESLVAQFTLAKGSEGTYVKVASSTMVRQSVDGDKKVIKLSPFYPA